MLAENLRKYADPNPPNALNQPGGVGVAPIEDNNVMMAFYQRVTGAAWNPHVVAGQPGLTTAGAHKHPYPSADDQWAAICNLGDWMRTHARLGTELVESERSIQSQVEVQIRGSSFLYHHHGAFSHGHWLLGAAIPGSSIRYNVSQNEPIAASMKERNNEREFSLN